MESHTVKMQVKMAPKRIYKPYLTEEEHLSWPIEARRLFE